MNKRERQHAAIRQHGDNLLAIYSQSKEKDATRLCKKLHRLERVAHLLTVDICNGEGNADELEAKAEKVREKAVALLGPGPEIFVNYDARGYALKISESDSKQLHIHKDFGGFGIICPEIEA